MKSATLILNFIAAASLVPPVAAAERLLRTWAEVPVYRAEVCPLPDAVMGAAEETASALFARIGVRLVFSDAVPKGNEGDAVTLRILKQAPKSLGLNIVGLASPDRVHGFEAIVFYDRVRIFYPTADRREAGVLLGYAMAHEIGHVLRENPGHSPAGVMKSCWTQRDVGPMLRQNIYFDRLDAARIHLTLETMWRGALRHTVLHSSSVSTMLTSQAVGH